MFYITDSDLDGLISEKEVKKLIFTIYQIFSEESTQFSSESSLIQQSLSTLKANKVYYEIMYGQGKLFEKLNIKKYINFYEFYEAISKINNYKYEIIPTFIDIKKCLLSKRNELKIEMNLKNRNDFSKISNELINKANLNLFNNSSFPNNFLKKCFDLKKIKKKKEISFRDKNMNIIKGKEKLLKKRNNNSYNEKKINYRNSLLKNNLSSLIQKYNNNLYHQSISHSILNNIYRNKSFIITPHFYKTQNIRNKFLFPKENKINKPVKENKDSINNQINNNNLKNSKSQKTIGISKIHNKNNNCDNNNSLSFSLIEKPKKLFKKSIFEINTKSIRSKFIDDRNNSNYNNINKLNNNSMKTIERGEYYKFNNIVFSPCIIIPKSPTIYNKIDITKNKNLKIKKRLSSIDNKDTSLLKPFEEIKNEVLNTLNYHKKKNDNNHLDTIIKIKQEIDEVTKKNFFNNS